MCLYRAHAHPNPSLVFLLYVVSSKYLRPLEAWITRLQDEKNGTEARFPTLPTLFKPILHIVLLVSEGMDQDLEQDWVVRGMEGDNKQSGRMKKNVQLSKSLRR